ncbi:MAG: transcriptional regulator [Bacillota bacterium]
MKLREALILRIEEICKERCKTISKLSLNGGMSPSNIYSLNKNRTNKTFVLTIAKFCDGAEISLAEFFTSPLFNDLDLEDEPEIKE